MPPWPLGNLDVDPVGEKRPGLFLERRKIWPRDFRSVATSSAIRRQRRCHPSPDMALHAQSARLFATTMIGCFHQGAMY